MEKLIGRLLPDPEDFVKMPYGVLAYAAFGLMLANFILGIIEPRVPFCIGMAMFGFLLIAAGRDHIADRELEAIMGTHNQSLHEKLVQWKNYQATTKHIKAMALGCLVLTALWVLQSTASLYG